MTAVNEWVILATVFVSVLIFVVAITNSFATRRELKKKLETATNPASRRFEATQKALDEVLSVENEVMRYYFEVLRRGAPQSLKAKLIQAGFFSRNAPLYFNAIRTAVSFAVFVLIWAALTGIVAFQQPTVAVFFAMMVSGATFILSTVVLERLGRNKQIAYRKLFPDFLDLLIVCVDAGLSIDAAIDRVAREFLVTNPDFGIHVSVISLEMRAGRSLPQALMNFADQTNLEEARSLSILFRQATELGSSVGRTLRVFANEMRQLRIVRAEEKANALPIKMLFPLAVFLFPVNLVIVLLPIMISILKTFLSISPSG